MLGSDPRSKAMGAALLATAANDLTLLEVIRERIADYTQRAGRRPSADFARAAIVTLAIDGLMMRESLRISPFTEAQREQVVRRAAEDCRRVLQVNRMSSCIHDAELRIGSCCASALPRCERVVARRLRQARQRSQAPPPPEVAVQTVDQQRRAARSDLHRAHRRLARSRSARARRRHPAQAPLRGRQPRACRASRCS